MFSACPFLRLLDHRRTTSTSTTSMLLTIRTHTMATIDLGKRGSVRNAKLLFTAPWKLKERHVTPKHILQTMSAFVDAIA